jgi:hypothetical protein
MAGGYESLNGTTENEFECTKKKGANAHVQGTTTPLTMAEDMFLESKAFGESVTYEINTVRN